MRFDLIAFDLYGTLLAIEKLEAALAGIVGADARKLLADWRKAQLARTWELNERGEYEPFDDVTARALAQVAPHLGPQVMERAGLLLLLQQETERPVLFSLDRGWGEQAHQMRIRR